MNPENPSTAKINEYIERAKQGETVESFQLPPKMHEAVEEGLKIAEEVPDEQEEKQIEEIRERLGISQKKTPEEEEKIKELNERIEKFNVEFGNLDQIIQNEYGNLEVVINGKKIEFEHFTILLEPENDLGREASVGYVKKTNREEDKGIGVPIYIELGKQLAQRGIKLTSSGAQYGPGHSIWMNLSRLGYTKRVNGKFEFTI